MVFCLFVCSFFAFGGEEPLKIISHSYVPDREFPHLLPYIIGGWDLKFEMGEPKKYNEIAPPGATIHVFLKNISLHPVTIHGALLNEIDLSKHIVTKHRQHRGIRAASYLLNDLETTPEQVKETLEALGAPLWYQAKPNPVPPGGFSELVIRLRFLPKHNRIKISLKTLEPLSVPSVDIDTNETSQFFIGSVDFNNAIDKLYLYISRDDKQEFEVKTVILDNREVSLPSSLHKKSMNGFLPMELSLNPSWEYGSFHFISVKTMGGKTASTVIRARDDFFALGMWGYRNYGNTDEGRAINTCKTFREHLFNTHMGMSGKQTGFLRGEQGLKTLDQMGLRLMTGDPRNEDVRNPALYARFLLDEPDAHEYAVKQLPGNRRIGAYAQGLVERQKRWTKNDPRTLALLNVDLTFVPENWLIYGQLPDILAVDPYYQMRLKDAYWKNPGRLAKHCHPYYVYAISEVARWASRPHPSHIILNSVSWREQNKKFRFGTPEEKRIEFYYALSAGAKGISYWWFTPYGKCHGCGSEEPEAKAMMREMALLNSEARAVLPLLSISSPALVSGEKIDPFCTTLPPWLMARTLFCGTDTALVLLVNRNHASDRLGTLFTPIPKCIISFQKPPWMKELKAFRFSGGEMTPLSYTTEEAQLEIEMKEIALTEMIILTQNPQITLDIQNRWEEISPRLKPFLQKNE